MRELKNKYNKKLTIMASILLGVIAIMVMFVNPLIGVGAIIAIAPLALTDQEQLLVDHIKSQVQSEIDKVSKGYISETKANENIEAKIKALEDNPVFAEKLKEMKADYEEKLKAQWEAVELKLKSEATEKPMTLRDSFKAAIMASDKVEEYTDQDGNKRFRIKGADDKQFDFQIKAVDMNTANAVRPGSTPGVNIGYLTDYGMQNQELANSMNQHFLTAGFSAESIADKYYGVLVETTETNGAGIKGETASAGDSSYLWKTIEYKVFDFSVKFRVHQNTLDDIENVLNRVTTIGVDRLLTVIDASTLGAAGDNTATPYGLLTATFFTAYDTTLRVGEVDYANIVNVIKNAKLQARKANEMVDCVILNSSDIAEIEDLKDKQANTVSLAGVKIDDSGKLAYIYGLKVIENDNLDANKFVVCKLGESVQYGMRSIVGMRMGYDLTTDFSKRIVTIQLDSRLAIGLGKPEAIIYCSDIDAARQLLTKVGA